MKLINFDSNVTIALSDKSDGNMKNPNLSNWTNEEINKNREKFFANAFISKDNTALINLSYAKTDFKKYIHVESALNYTLNMPITAMQDCDGIATHTAGIGIFLPLADCLGAVLYDPYSGILMVTHAGRHNLEQNGLTAAVAYLEGLGCYNKYIKAWLSPCAGAKNYPLFAFDGKGIEEIAKEQLNAAGVYDIISESIDTTESIEYFSHSQGDKDKRFAIAACIQKETAPRFNELFEPLFDIY